MMTYDKLYCVNNVIHLPTMVNLCINKLIWTKKFSALAFSINPQINPITFTINYLQLKDKLMKLNQMKRKFSFPCHEQSVKSIDIVVKLFFHFCILRCFEHVTLVAFCRSKFSWQPAYYYEQLLLGSWVWEGLNWVGRNVAIPDYYHGDL